MSRWKIFKEKYLGLCAKGFSWILNIGGIVLAIMSFINDAADLGWKVVLSIVIMNSILLIIVTIYETLLYKKGSAIENRIRKEKDEEIEGLKDSLASMTKQYDKLIYYYQFVFSTLNNFVSRLCEVNTKFLRNMENVEEMREDYAYNKVPIGEKTKKSFKEQEECAEKEYRRALLKEFNQFLGDITNKLKDILDMALREKGCMLETSISVKQFNRIVSNPDNVSDVFVITTYRDHPTYTLGKREVGKKRYKVSKNTDFVYCLTHSYFLKNNILKEDKTYDNEHKEFLNYYNCAIVVPISYSYPDCTHIFGYLTCDILNENYIYDKPLDEQMAEIIVTTAKAIGFYFDNIDYQCDYVLKENIMDIIFNMKQPKF